MSQTQKLGTRATSFRRDKDGTLTVQYHATVVVTVKSDGTVILDTGGWRTVTTKLRMNQASNQFGLNYQVSQKDGEWYVHSTDDRWPWKVRFDGETVTLPLANKSGRAA